jgi:hypothetical protein
MPPNPYAKKYTQKKQREGDGATGSPQLRHGDKVRTTRGNITQFPNATYGYRHMQLPDKYEYLMGKHKGQTKRYNAYLKALAAYEKTHGKKEGGTRRRHRSTRRR